MLFDVCHSPKKPFAFLLLCLLFLGGGQALCLSQVIHRNRQEDIQEDVWSSVLRKVLIHLTCNFYNSHICAAWRIQFPQMNRIMK